MHCRTVQYSAVQCSAGRTVQCNAVQYNLVQCIALMCSAMNCIAVNNCAVQCKRGAEIKALSSSPVLLDVLERKMTQHPAGAGEEGGTEIGRIQTQTKSIFIPIW